VPGYACTGNPYYMGCTPSTAGNAARGVAAAELLAEDAKESKGVKGVKEAKGAKGAKEEAKAVEEAKEVAAPVFEQPRFKTSSSKLFG
jgi:hypothetical protein